jgi:hypothetical protein
MVNQIPVHAKPVGEVANHLVGRHLAPKPLRRRPYRLHPPQNLLLVIGVGHVFHELLEVQPATLSGAKLRASRMKGQGLELLPAESYEG